jgi:tRNA dimethylallyltransferase
MVSTDLIPLIAVVGPTGAGKTEIAVWLAEQRNGEIVSADSMQVYRGMDIGSATPSAAELMKAPHHLIDCVDPDTAWTAMDYQIAAQSAIRDIHRRGRQAILAGGTGLYVSSILFDLDFSAVPAATVRRQELEQLARETGRQALHDRLAKLDPAAAARIHPNNIKKIIRAIEVCETTGKAFPEFLPEEKFNPAYRAAVIGLTWDREELYRRIEQRVDRMVADGLAEEVRSLEKYNLDDGCPALQGIGYKEYIEYFRKGGDEESCIAAIKQHSRNFAKRQLTWFRRYPQIRWFNRSELSGKELRQAVLEYVDRRLERK